MTITSTTTLPGILALSDPRARNAELTGAKAAALATAAAHGLPVLEGFVLTTAWSSADDAPEAQWRRLSRQGRKSLVVRSSSIAEDGAEQSMAGLFTSVLDVRDWQGFRDAVDEVIASGPAVPAESKGAATMAVLVQPFLAATWGGVLFTADPVTGRTDRMLLTAVRGGPNTVVSGVDGGWTARLSRRGRVREVATENAPKLPIMVRHRVVEMARHAERVFGTPLDIEWAVDSYGRVLLLQARPITALHGGATGPILGPGPLAETFPDALRPLEQDLWLTPLAEGMRTALGLTGAASGRRIAASPVATTVLGTAVADLQLLGVIPPRRNAFRLLDPRPGARRLGAAMRVGRLRAAMPELAQQICERVDTDLAEVPQLAELRNADLLAVLDNARTALRSIHGYEALAGMLAGRKETAPTAAAMALAALDQARAEGVDSDRIIAEYPVVLALVPPRIAVAPEVPGASPSAAAEEPLSAPGKPSGAAGSVNGAGQSVGAAATNGNGKFVGRPTSGGMGKLLGAGASPVAGIPASAELGELALAREALRLRARWVQELTARVAWELGARLLAAEVLTERESVALLGLEELRVAVQQRIVPEDLAERDVHDGALPAEFRLATDGYPIAITRKRSRAGQGVGAGGGVGRGVVHMGDQPPAGSVLVVRHLDPRLAVVIPRLAGLIAETGSPLSHLAILARERDIPVVVGYPDATRRLPDGAVVQLDGRSGEVQTVTGSEEG